MTEPSPDKMLAWQPIETAPDTEYINVVLVARNVGKQAVMPAVFDGDKWLALTIAGMMEFQKPTHWMPLPAPPQSPEENPND